MVTPKKRGDNPLSRVVLRELILSSEVLRLETAVFRIQAGNEDGSVDQNERPQKLSRAPKEHGYGAHFDCGHRQRRHPLTNPPQPLLRSQAVVHGSAYFLHEGEVALRTPAQLIRRRVVTTEALLEYGPVKVVRVDGEGGRVSGK